MSPQNPFPTLYSRAGSFNPAMYESSAGGPSCGSKGGKGKRNGTRKLSRYNRRSRKINHSRTRRFRKF